MIDMDIKVKSKVILLPGFFIVFCIGLLQFVKADLPNQGRLDAIPCVRERFGEDFLRPTYRNSDDSEGDKLSDGEYFGAACEDLSPDNFEAKIEYETKGTYDYNGNEMKKCLARNNHQALFEKYQAIGVQYPEDDPSKLFHSPIYNFFIGMCKSEKEEVEFDKVTVPGEKTKVLSCLAKCTGTFLKRIELILLFGKDEALTILQNKVNAIKLTKLNESNNDPKQQKKKTTETDDINGLYQDLKNVNIDGKSAYSFLGDYEEIADKKKSIKMIKDMAKKYLERDSDFFHYIHPAKNYDKENLLGRFDSHLHTTFWMYQNCSRIDCGMTLDSAPIFNLIEEGSKDPKKYTLAWAKKFFKDISWITPKQRNFFKVLVEPSDYNQSGSNED